MTADAETFEKPDDPRLPFDFHVEVDLDWYKDLFRAQNLRYNRKVGIFGLVFFLPFTALGIFITAVNFESYGLTGALITLMFGALSLYEIQLIRGRGILFGGSRKLVTAKFFLSYGMELPKEPISREETRCGYDVSAEELGFVEHIRYPSGLDVTVRRPWAFLTGTGSDTPGGYVFAADDGKNSSLARNLVGVNYAFREDLPCYPLAIPRTVVSENPWLVPWVREQVDKQRKALKADDAARERVVGWAGTTAVFPDGTLANLEDEKDSARIDNLIKGNY